MGNVVKNLKTSLIKELNNADEVWVAVALITSGGLSFLQEQLNNETIQHYLIGINLPTEPRALRTLYKLEIKDKIATRIYTEKEFFHPKVYVIRTGKNYKAYIGSANCTDSGLSKNVEISYIVENQTDCKELIDWFNTLNEISFSLKESFLIAYEANYEKRKQRKRKDEEDAKKLKKKLEEEHQVSMAARKELIDVLKWHRKQDSYPEHKAERKRDIKELRESLDYPIFKNINIDTFFSLWQLGHLISIPIPTLKREIKKFRKVLKFLCDDSIDVSLRYNEVLSGSLKIRGVAEATISKILTIHDPSKYAVRNDKINSVLTDYGIEIPKRISAGEKYKAVNNFLIELSKESKMDNLAILDLYLYLEANE